MNPSAHRSVVYLNNTAVSLLQNHCYQQGLKTLSSAVAWMNLSFQDSSWHQVSSESSSPNRLQGDIREAAERLAKPQVSQHTGTSRTMDIKVLSDQDPSTFLFDQQTASPLPSAWHLLRIDSTQLDYVSDMYILDIQSSIILYNFGMAYRFIASTTNDPLAKNCFHVAALRLFHLSYTILTSGCGNAEQVEDWQMQQTILTAILVLTNMIELCESTGMRDYGDEYRSRLEFLLKSSRETDALDSKRLPAAAA